jgi:hypothetical protein
MTELLTRPQRAAADDAALAESASIWLRGSLAALWAVAVGLAGLLVIVLVSWAADSRAGAGAMTAVRGALQVWLVAHRVPLRVGGGTVAIAPLLLTAVLAFLVARAAAVLTRGLEVSTIGGAGRVCLAVGLPYGVLVTFVAAGATSATVHPAPVAALGVGMLFGCAAAGWGSLRGAGLLRDAWDRLPGWCAVPAVAGGAAAAVLVAGSTLLVLAAIAGHGAEATRSIEALGGGPVAAFSLVTLNIALLPNAAVWTVGYLSGPGFAVGAGTSVTLQSVHTGALPALPLVAAVPGGPASVVVEMLGIAVLVGAGLVAARLVARQGMALSASLLHAAGAGAGAGLCLAVLAALADGPVGPGRMATVGTSPWQVGLVVAGEVAVVAAGAVGAMTWRRGR